MTTEEVYHDGVRTVARKRYIAIEVMRNGQRVLKTQNPHIGEVNLEELDDNRYNRKSDESDFFDWLYGK